MSIPLTVSDIHVWRACLDEPGLQVGGDERVLSPFERATAAKFRFDRDRLRYITAHCTLRAILARYLNTDPAAIRFRYSQHGKPSLASNDADHDIEFNLSHAGGIALYAMAWRREVGIDVEHMRPELLQEGIAERFFSPVEMESLRTVPADQRTAAFFRCWTRKEAYVKARGEGLSFPLDGFAVSLRPDEPAAILWVAGDPNESHRWSVEDLAVGPEYAAAIVGAGRGWTLRHWQWVG